jgi:pSer/pThr/pTyr-binding forkhead associated (FHA) protein
MAIKLIIRRQGAAPNAPPLAEQVFEEPIITIGSEAASTLRLDDAGIAPEQAIIIDEDGQLLFINRATGTRLNGEALAREARRPVSDGDTLDLGPFQISISLNHNAHAPAVNARREPETRTPTPPAQTGGEPPSSDFGERRGATASSGGNSQAGSFAAILDSLRTEEDSFYFEVVSPTRGRRRVAIENAEMLVGWDETGRDVSCDAASVLAPRAVVRKDWSGVVVQPHGPATIEVNGEPVESVRRLRNGDRLTLLPTAVTVDPQENFLVFHEPATLVVLDSLLPQQLPPPVAPSAPNVEAANSAATNQDTGSAQVPVSAATPRRGLFRPDRRYFGHFTFAEVAIMFVGTLVAAGIIFLILEFL